MEQRIGLLGVGNMGIALLGGWLDQAVLRRDQVRFSELSPERCRLVEDRYQVTCAATSTELVAWAQCVVLAVKPQALEHALAGIAFSPEHLVVSLCAGVTTARLSALAGSARIVRTMPNTPALVGAGATAVCAGPGATPEDLELTRHLFAALGLCVVIQEDLMDVVTGLSGSGPAYTFLFMEALTDGAVRNGLPRDLALQLATQTVFGAAKLVMESGELPAVLRDRVTSPGGTTAQGLLALERAGFQQACVEAVTAATARSRELAMASDAPSDPSHAL